MLWLAAGAVCVAWCAVGCGTDVNLGAPGRCREGTVACGDVCVVLDADPGHCGACERVCPSGLCSAGDCVACQPPLAACADACVDLSADPIHCGGCGVVCTAASWCQEGKCVCSGTVCGEACVDTSSDPAHCGGCFLGCAPAEACVGGLCQSGCGPELVPCGDVCVDILYDPSHCGGCFSPCPPDSYCDLGGCIPFECPSGVCGVCETSDVSFTPRSFGSTAGGSDFLAGSCGGFGSPEVGVWFTAPVSGTYVFDLSGSLFDTVLYALDAMQCFELACNDDWVSTASQLQLGLAAGEQVVLVIDGGGGEQGDYGLTWSLTDCPAADLGALVPQTVMGSTLGGPSQLEGSCAFTASPETTYLFTAPFDGTYSFDTAGSNFDTVLYLLDGSCGGVELACDDNAASDGTSALSIDLGGGQQVVVVVDGYGGGSFVLSVQ